MIVTVEISYYPLTDDYSTPIDYFIQQISSPNIEVEIGKMSTLLIGEYHEVMGLLNNAMGELMEKYPSIFNIRISNSCPV